MKIWRNFLQFIWRYFSVRLLLATLLATWRRDLTDYGRGFDLRRYLEVFALNTVSRLIGFVVRLVFIFLALVLEVLLLLTGLLLFALWLGAVVFVPGFFVVGFYFLFAGDEIGIFYLVFSFLLANLGYFAFRISTKKSYDQMELEELMKQRWFSRVWRRLGLKKAPANLRELKNFLAQENLSENDWGLILRWEIFFQQGLENRRYFWRRENLLARPPLTRNFAFGYTFHLDKYTRDLNLLCRLDKEQRILAHTDEVEKIERILSRSAESNVLLLGDPGSGKTSTVMALAKFITEGRTIGSLVYKRVLELKIDEALAGLPNQSTMEERLNLLLGEAARAGNVVLIIEDIDRYVTQQEGLGKIDLSSVLTSFLPLPTIQVVGTTNFRQYHQFLEQNQSLMKYFEVVEIKEPTFGKLFFILCDLASQMEAGSPLKVSYQALKKVAQLSSRYFQETPQPKRAIDILKEAINLAQRQGEKLVTSQAAEAVVAEKTGVAVGILKQEEKEKLLNLEEVLHQRVINQNQAIKEVASAMRRRRLEIGDIKRPIGSFLFLGPTGVGKTETAKALAAAYFGDVKRLIRLDMTEYQELDAVERLIGSSDGQIVGQLVSAVRERPFALLLLDEIEKANKDVVQIFMQVIEDGFLTDGLGRKVSFREMIIIATSNAGANLIFDLVKEDASLAEDKPRVLDAIQKEGIFKPEFINRFDSVVLFEPLSKENLFKVAQLMLRDLAKRLEAQQLIFQFADDLVTKIAQLGYEPEYGARPMRRVIQQKVEDLIARKVLAGSIQKNTPFKIAGSEI